MSPDKFRLQSIFVSWADHLIILSLATILVLEEPCSCSLWLIVLELSLIVCSIGISPLSIQEFVLKPFSDVLHSSSIEYICSITVLFAIEPLSRVDIFV